jgi:hypothetical protein
MAIRRPKFSALEHLASHRHYVPARGHPPAFAFPSAFVHRADSRNSHGRLIATRTVDKRIDLSHPTHK